MYLWLIKESKHDSSSSNVLPILCLITHVQIGYFHVCELL
jgi:hypothetical protein